MKKPFFSIGIIFKDEIRCLERCLKSLQPLRDAVSCELVMADTGSSDGSREIAERYADILFDFPWCDDFSAARNAVMDRCSGEWYFTIDADEWLTGSIEELIAFSREKSLPHDLAAINIHNYNTVELDENAQYNDFSGIRLCRMSTGMRYTGCIHEKWIPPEGSPVAMMLYDTWLSHDGYAYANKTAETAKYSRNMALLRKKLAQNPDDMQTLVECIDMTKHDAESAEYAQKVMEVIHKKPRHWEKFGPVVFRGAVSVGKLQKLPELRKWIAEAFEWFPNSIYIQIDVAYYALADYFDAGDYVEAVYWGVEYQEALANYRTGKYDHSELLRGALEYSAPFWERKVFILLSHAYLELGQFERAFAALQSIRGEEIEEEKQIESITQMMMRLHRTARLDTPSLIEAFWERINRPIPTEEMARKRHNTFIRTASVCFAEKYRTEESSRSETLRHGYTLFSSLDGKCPIGTAAVILNMDAPEQLEERLAEIEKWGEFPIAALAHALERGIRFPLSSKPLNIEEMDSLAARLAKETDQLLPLALRAAESANRLDLQSICWARGLIIAAVRMFPWVGTNQDKEQGMELARKYAHMEKKFLPLCYAPSALTNENLFLLPPMHRFGLYCAQAFDALEDGDIATYVRLLREGLTSSEGMRDMVEFLFDHTPELKDPSDELKAMAEQIRSILSRFSSDDPAVTALKQSEAYRKVSHLIEGLNVPVLGGLIQ